jgi:large subunit ribosomal protein L6
MSKIGKQPIVISSGVTFSVDKDNQVSVKGSKGELFAKIDSKVSIEIKDGKVIVSLKNNNRKNYAVWGLSRMLIFNMIEGVGKGFEKKLEIQGIGYKAIQKGKDLELALGFSHPVLFKAPQGIEFKVEKNIISIAGFDKQLVGQVAADIRNKKKPEPYKGKGIRYAGEHVRRKSGKKVAGTTEK